MKTIIALKDQRYGVCLTVCQNVETVCDGRDLSPWEEEATAAAGSKAQAVIHARLGELADDDRLFANWHGGKFSHGGFIAKTFYVREFESDIDEDGEECGSFGEWEWIDEKKVPAETIAEVDSVIDAASDAMNAELDRWEARVAADNRTRFIAYNITDLIVWGTGETEEEARADALDWISRNAETEDQPDIRENLTLIRCTDELAARVTSTGGNTTFAVDHDQYGEYAK